MLYRAVEKTKIELSSEHESHFRFVEGFVSIDPPVFRGDFIT